MKTKTLPGSHPSRERVLKGEKTRCLQLSLALTQDGVHHIGKSGLFLSFSACCCFLGQFVKVGLRQTHWDIVLILHFYMATESLRVFIFCFSLVPVVVVTNIANCRGCLLLLLLRL